MYNKLFKRTIKRGKNIWMVCFSCEFGVKWGTTSAPTQSAIDNYNIAPKLFKSVLTELKSIAAEVTEMGKQLDVKGAPATTGRWPSWE